ncbi:hypothetical protein L208DRAFT_927474 [Tricholoma matsutake]|nr:hypothetical protein L208DRAFT_927474 [Tricholoma matsutake 945]
MARRSAPPSSVPSYLAHPSSHSQRHSALPPSNENASPLARFVFLLFVSSLPSHCFFRFIETQIMAPDKLPGNISILTGVGLFLGGIIVARTWGELMIPS